MDIEKEKFLKRIEKKERERESKRDIDNFLLIINFVMKFDI